VTVASGRQWRLARRVKLTVRCRPLGHLPAGRELTYRLPPRAALGDVDAMIRAYAPPYALAAAC
jgi:hypothetical protein